MMNSHELKNIIEALLMSSPSPLTVDAMIAVFDEGEKPSKEQVKTLLDELGQAYDSSGIELKLLASGYCFQTQARYRTWIARLFSEKPVKYSGALLETLAVIAYRQPVTRADIENIRGVASSSSMFKTLLDRDWIRIAGFRDAPGKPAVYTTTKVFLDYFNLSSLNELPLLGVLNDDKRTIAENIESSGIGFTSRDGEMD